VAVSAGNTSSWLTKTDLSRWVRCPYSWWLLDTGQITFAETVDEFRARLIDQGVEFQDLVESSAMPIVVDPAELTKMLRRDMTILATPTYRNERLRISGRPDGIETAGGAVYPIEVKSHKTVTRLDELELAFYWLLLEPLRTRKNVAPQGRVILRRDGKPVVVTVEIAQHRIDRVKALLTDIRRARLYGVRPQVCRCQVCATTRRSEVMTAVTASRHPTLIHGVGRAYAAALARGGYDTWDSLLDCDADQVLDDLFFAGCTASPGVAQVRLWQLHARSYQLKQPVLADRAKFPIPSRYIALDLEYFPHIWLIGATVVNGDERHEVSLWADTADQELGNLRQLAALVAAHPRLPIVTWSGTSADIPQLVAAGRRHHLDGLLDPLLARHVDEYRWVERNCRLPIPGLGVKDVGEYFGHPRLSAISDGLQALGLYHQYQRSGDAAIRAQLIDYNHDDVDTLIEVTHQLRHLTRRQRPRRPARIAV
jgi:predicted RecB family nuclease